MLQIDLRKLTCSIAFLVLRLISLSLKNSLLLILRQNGRADAVICALLPNKELVLIFRSGT